MLLQVQKYTMFVHAIPLIILQLKVFQFIRESEAKSYSTITYLSCVVIVEFDLVAVTVDCTEAVGDECHWRIGQPAWHRKGWC